MNTLSEGFTRKTKREVIDECKEKTETRGGFLACSKDELRGMKVAKDLIKDREEPGEILSGHIHDAIVDTKEKIFSIE